MVQGVIAGPSQSSGTASVQIYSTAITPQQLGGVFAQRGHGADYYVV